MDKGQHLRLFLNKGTAAEEDMQVFALATDFTFHCSATTENSTTKDSTDIIGLWDEFEVTAKSYDIQISALIGVDEDEDAVLLNDIQSLMVDGTIKWELAIVSGEQNRTQATLIAEGECKISSINPVGQNRQNATYSATLNGYGPIVVAS